MTKDQLSNKVMSRGYHRHTVNNSELKKSNTKLFKIETSKLSVVLLDEKVKMSVEQCPARIFSCERTFYE